MKTIIKKTILSASCLMLLPLLYGCSADKAPSGTGADKAGQEVKAVPKPPEPVTLTLFPWNPMSETEFKLFIEEPLKKKYPHITVKLLQQPRTDLEKLIAANATPDLIISAVSFLSTFKDLSLLEDITPLIKKHSVDTSRFDQMYFESEWLIGDKALYGLPYSVPFGALYYNKDIFNKFGVPYPKDGMNWDETIELGRKVTRLEDGIQYKGFLVDVNRVLLPMGLQYIDPVAQKSLVGTSAKFKTGYEIYQRIVNIPGNKLEKGTRFSNFVEGQAAMLAHIQQFNDAMEQATKKGLNWDVAQFPSHADPKFTYLDYNPQIIIPTKTSKNKDAAMQVIDMFTSDEVQRLVSAQGQLTSLKNPDIIAKFASNLEYVKGKSVASIFKSKASKPNVRTDYDTVTIDFVFNQAAADIEKGIDLNTVLRSVDEKINKAIDEQKKK